MLWTKLHIPQPKKNLVHRPYLFEKLNEGFNRKLILVSATAGYGKTTLLSDWIHRNKIPTVWYSVDQSDNDPGEFLTSIIKGIQTIHARTGKDAMEILNSPMSVSLEYVVGILMNDILTLKKEFILVFDDLHLISSEEVFRILNYIIEHKPRQLKIAILTRSDPPLSVARFRSQNELLEIRSEDLSFTQSDIAEFFNKKLRLGLNGKDLSLLEQKTEGWIAGLQLTAISLQGKENIPEFIQALAGDNRYIMDYLIEEVLNNLDHETREFLLRTSILEKLSASLCDKVLQENSSQLLLESLDKNNMFIVPLDNERKWFRYHHLFGVLLEQRLRIRNKEIIPDLHQKASLWFEENNMLIHAVEHSLKAGHTEKALQLVDGIVDHLWETSQYNVIHKFGSLLNEDDILINKKFGIIYAWVQAIKGELAESEKYLGKIEKELRDANPTDENRSLLGRVYETYNLVKVFSGDVETAFKYSELAIQHIPEEDIVWDSWAHISFGESNLLQFELQKAIQSFYTAREHAQKINNLYLGLISTSKIAYVLRLKGEYKEALSLCNNLLESFNANTSIEGYRIGLLSSILYSIIGYIAAEQGRIEEGIQNALKGYELSRGVLSLSFQTYSALLLAETYYKAGEFDKALVLIEELEIIINKNIAQWLYVLTNTLKCKLLILKNKDDQAKTILNKKAQTGKNHSFETFFYNVAIARYKITRQNHEEAFSLLRNLTLELKNRGATELLTEAELLTAKAFMLENENEKAIASVIKALTYTQNENLIRTYINEGAEIESLLKEIQQRKKVKSTEQLDSVSSDYIDVLIRAFEKEKRTASVVSEEGLSSRELDTLKLIAEDLTNQEIANALYISLATVKTHVRNILLKLEAKNRSEAVSIAREKQII